MWIGPETGGIKKPIEIIQKALKIEPKSNQEANQPQTWERERGREKYLGDIKSNGSDAFLCFDAFHKSY